MRKCSVQYSGQEQEPTNEVFRLRLHIKTSTDSKTWRGRNMDMSRVGDDGMAVMLSR